MTDRDEKSIREIWRIVADAYKANKRLTRDEMLNIMQHCHCLLEFVKPKQSA